VLFFEGWGTSVSRSFPADYGFVSLASAERMTVSLDDRPMGRDGPGGHDQVMTTVKSRPLIGWVPVALIVLSLVPVLAGAVRVTELTSGAEVTSETHPTPSEERRSPGHRRRPGTAADRPERRGQPVAGCGVDGASVDWVISALPSIHLDQDSCQ
jgi:hypothetical protein